MSLPDDNFPETELEGGEEAGNIDEDPYTDIKM